MDLPTPGCTGPGHQTPVFRLPALCQDQMDSLGHPDQVMPTHRLDGLQQLWRVAYPAVPDAVMIVAFACLNDEDWQAAASARGMDSSAREFFQCVMDVLGGPEGTAAILGSRDDAASANSFIASTGCGLELGLVE